MTAALPAGVPAPEFLGCYDDGEWVALVLQDIEGRHPATPRHLEEFRALAERGRAALSGDTLVHTDIRADNILLNPRGRVTIVDWPSACRGPPWLDTLLLLINAGLYGGQNTHALLTKHAALTGADPHDLIAVLSGLASFFADAARQPPPKGLPTVRAFQRAQAEAVLFCVRYPPSPTDSHRLTCTET